MTNNTKKETKEIKMVLLRLPTKVWEELSQRAESQNRSVNGQIVQELINKS